MNILSLAKQISYSIKQSLKNIGSSILFPVRRIKKAVAYCRINGFVGFMKRIWHSVFTYREIVMRHKQLRASDLDFVNSLNIHIASEKDIEEGYEDVWYTKEEALERLRKGHILFLVKDKGINVYYSWVHLLEIDIPWLGIKKMRISPDVAYMATVYVLPQYRGRFLLKRSLKFIEKYLLDNTTVNKTFTVTAPDNVVASKILALGGYLPYQHIKYFNIMGFRLYVVESIENGKSRIKKLFVHNSDFWNMFSPILKTK